MSIFVIKKTGTDEYVTHITDSGFVTLGEVADCLNNGWWYAKESREDGLEGVLNAILSIDESEGDYEVEDLTDKPAQQEPPSPPQAYPPTQHPPR